MYVWLSAGSMLAVSLAAGITPDEMVKVLEGTSSKLDQLTPLQFYNPNLREFVERPAKFFYDLFTYVPGVLFELVRQVPRLPEVVGPRFRAFLDHPNYVGEELAMALTEHVSPSGDSGGNNHIPTAFRQIEPERWLAAAREHAQPNDFREFARKRGKQLYVAGVTSIRPNA